MCCLVLHQRMDVEFIGENDPLELAQIPRSCLVSVPTSSPVGSHHPTSRALVTCAPTRFSSSNTKPSHLKTALGVPSESTAITREINISEWPVSFNCNTWTAPQFLLTPTQFSYHRYLFSFTNFKYRFSKYWSNLISPN